MKRLSSFQLVIPALFLLSLLTACGQDKGMDLSAGGGGGGALSFNYFIGGAVSGLSGTVVLQNNGGDDLTLNANGAFTFATVLANSATYNVTVLTQPAGQTCTVSNGVGTVSSANVTSVSVVCSGLAYTVGGTLSGLAAGKSVVLQDNGGDSIALTANGAFTFPTAVAVGATYTVSVHTQPAGQACSLTSNTGTIAGANVTNVGVTCATNSYTVGGSVGGLTGTNTVVLQNNGGNNLTVSANGTFTFTTALTNGSAYNVTVLTQPTGQTCTAASNTGTVSGANVTGVSVSCVTNSYTVGGSVSGLGASKSVVLQNNGSGNLTVSANGAFTFGSSVLSGTNYYVTVLTQPSGQTCTVTNSSGTMSGANVTNVGVTCSAAAYTVGGTLSGLAASTSVVLQNNSGDSIALAANGAFTFPTAVADGAGYAVTVYTQPFGQACSLSNSTGTIAGANITNVGVTCATNSYTVGVSVGGLNGTVVLQNNAGDNLTINTNGASTFATAIANGSGYNVAVLTQPAGQTCTASSNTGTISGANVTGISISCVNNTYTVGGATDITLANTTPMVLQLNGGNDLTVNPGDTAFTFSGAPLIDGATYNVTILTQPDTQVCTANTNTGTVSGANVTTVIVNCI